MLVAGWVSFLIRRRPALLLFTTCLILTSCSAPTWSERGPAFGGRLSAIVADSTGNTLLTASPGGGVWRSTDGGSTWNFPAQYGLGDNAAVHLEWDAVKQGRLFLLTWNGLYATTDNGDSWTNLVNPGGFPAPLQVSQTAIADAKPFSQMVFSARGGAQYAVFAAIPCSGLFYSFDGVTFTQTWPFSGGSSNLDNCIGAIATDAFSGRVYFSTFNRDGNAAHLFRSNCTTPWRPGTPCLTWQQANNGLPQETFISTLTSVTNSSGTADHLVAQITASSNFNTYTTNDGMNWTLQSSQSNQWSPRTLVYTGNGGELLQGNVDSSYTNNLGTTWTTFDVTQQHPDVRAVTPVASMGKVWAVTDGSIAGTYANITRWNWTPGSVPTGGINLGNSGLTVLQAYFAGVVPTNGSQGGNSRRVFVGAQDNGGFCNDTLGPNGWSDFGGPGAGGSSDIFGFAAAPSDPNRAYARSGDPTVFGITTNAASAASCSAVTWHNAKPTSTPANAPLTGPSSWSYHSIAVHPTNADRLYFALSADEAETTNASAATPLVTHHSLPNNLRPTVIYVDANSAIYLGTVGQGAYKSVDDGITWTPWGPGTNPAPAVVTAITSSGGSNPTFWIATTSGLYKGTAGGTSWTLATGGGGYTISDVTVDPSCTTRVYAALGFVGILGEHRGGIRFSADNGATWTSITSGEIIHQGPVSMVQVDSSQPTTVYAASYGRGFWVYDWAGQLPGCSQ